MVHLPGLMIEPIILMIGVSVLADSERNVAASKCWIVTTVTERCGQGCHSFEDDIDCQNLDQTVVRQLGTLVLN